MDSSTEGLGDSTVDFCIYVESQDPQWYSMYSENSDDYAVEIIGPALTTGTIDPKYLPMAPTMIYIGDDSDLYEDEALTTQLSYEKALALASDPNLIIYWNVDETYYRPVRVTTSGISVEFVVHTDEGLARYQVYDPNAGPV